MIELIKVEFQKSKRTTTHKFILISPFFSLILSGLWGGGQSGAYNWWYTMFLPGMLAIISAQVITREKSLSYKSILLYPQDKGIIWLGKILYLSILLVISSCVFMLGVEVFGLLFGSTIFFKANILATVTLTLTLLFNIPLNMFLTAQFNMFAAVLFNLGMTVAGVVSHASKTDFILKVLPYGTPSSLMAPILRILPNGLPVPEGSPFLNGDMILREIVISVIIFIILAALTAIWFSRKEVN